MGKAQLGNLSLFHVASVELAGLAVRDACHRYIYIYIYIYTFMCISALVLPGFSLSSSRLGGGGWQTFPVKGQTLNILGFEGHMFSVTTIQLCH